MLYLALDGEKRLPLKIFQTSRDAEAHTFFEHLTKREICASDTQNDSEAEALPQLINALLDMVS